MVYIVDSEKLLKLLFHAEGNRSFCSDSEANLFDECNYYIYQIIIPSHSFVEVLDKIRLGRLSVSQSSMSSLKAVCLLDKLLNEYYCHLDVFGVDCINHLFDCDFLAGQSLSPFITQKIAELYTASYLVDE